MLTWELIGAVVGAGMASGREIASFFSQYGIWSYPGILLAVFVMMTLCSTSLPQKWQGRWPDTLWRLLLNALLISTGAAMLGGGAELGRLVLPMHGSYWLGMLMTCLLAYWIACRTTSGLAWVSRLLLAALGVLLLLGFTKPRLQAAVINTGHPLQGLLRGMAYGGFNAALQVPVMQEAALPGSKKKGAVRCAGILAGLLLLLGNGLLLYHPALLGEEMPFIHIVMQFGAAGYLLGTASLYLAILSTLAACIRGIGGNTLALAGMLMISLIGFEGVVGQVYPILGGGCFLMLAAAKFTNSCRKPFLSRTDML